MPEGKTEIFDYRLSEKQDQSLPYDFMDEVFLCFGPENWSFYTIDCYQLYLHYGHWEGRPGFDRPTPTDFLTNVLKDQRIKIMNNWRYSLEGKPVTTNKNLAGKMFLGIRYVVPSGNRFHY